MHRWTPRLKLALPWIVLGLALILATQPVWRVSLLGLNPTLDDVLLVSRCSAPLAQPLENLATPTISGPRSREQLQANEPFRVDGSS
jgi:hypothetical protein